MNATRVLSSSGDWEAIYVDGRKIVEDHSVSAEHLLEALGYKVDFIESQEDEFPELLHNIQEVTE